MEVAEPQAAEEYVLRVSVDSSSAVGVGNYIAIAEFIQPSDQMNEMASGEVSDDADTFLRWTATETKLIRFDLATGGATASQGVQLTIFDAHTGELRAVVTSTGDVTRTTLAWIQQGDYILRFSTITTDGLPVEDVTYALSAEGVSDDQGDGDDSDDDEYNYEYDYSYGYEYDYDYDYDYDYYNNPHNDSNSHYNPADEDGYDCLLYTSDAADE